MSAGLWATFLQRWGHLWFGYPWGPGVASIPLPDAECASGMKESGKKGSCHFYSFVWYLLSVALWSHSCLWMKVDGHLSLPVPFLPSLWGSCVSAGFLSPLDEVPFRLGTALCSVKC